MAARNDYVSDQEVRWCPGCGDYAILASVQKVLPELNIPRENFVFISGIGCSSRFPYYLNTYGFHTIHGRAPTVATGLKMTRPELSVWIITGDGDGLSIGASHLLHLMRRNLDVTILLFNNKIYGLTKGQYSPTSEQGKKTKTTPHGSLEEPFNPIQLALAANCSFVARAIDVDSQNLQSVLKQAAAHRGTSFVEIYQNCNVFNDGAFAGFSERAHRPANTVVLTPGEPLIFGENQDKGLCFEKGRYRIVDKVKATLHEKNLPLSQLMALNACHYPEFPVPIGVFRAIERQLYAPKTHPGALIDSNRLDKHLKAGKTWQVE